MFTHLNTPLGQLRLISFSEGVSYVLLLGVAMPLKYMAGIPIAVRIAGSLHGFLFVIFVLALLRVMVTQSWGILRAMTAFAAAVLPLCAFIFDRSLKRELEATVENLSAS